MSFSLSKHPHIKRMWVENGDTYLHFSSNPSIECLEAIMISVFGCVGERPKNRVRIYKYTKDQIKSILA